MGTLRWKTILLSRGRNASFLNLFKAYWAGYSILFLAPILFFGGELFRAGVLKKKEIFSWPKSLASVIIERAMEWAFNIFFIICGLSFFILKTGSIPKNIYLIFLTLLFVVSLSMVLFCIKIFSRDGMVNFLESHFSEKLNGDAKEVAQEVFSFFDIENVAMWKALELSFIRMILMFLRSFLLLIFLNQNINVWFAFSILSFHLLAVMIPIPASLGSHEAFQIFAFNALGLSVTAATAFTLITRSVEFLVSIIGLVFLFKLAIELSKETLFEKMDKLLEIKNDQ